MIILEGNETTGKTTVSSKIKEKLGWSVIKGSSFEQSQCTNTELFNKFLHMVTTDNDNIIFDRFIYSNLVYADLYNDFAILSSTQVRLIEEEMKRKNVKTFYLWASLPTLKQRLRERGDEYVEEDKLESINEKYEDVLRGKDNVYWVNTERYNSDEIVEIILDLCKLTPVK